MILTIANAVSGPERAEAAATLDAFYALPDLRVPVTRR